jgi:DNA-binding NtrC family response regulator
MGLLSNLVGMEGSDAKPMTIWIVEDNDDYRQVLADGLRLEIGCGVRTFSSTEEALRERQRATGGGTLSSWTSTSKG